MGKNIALITFELMEDTLEKDKRQMTIQRITACVQVKGDYQVLSFLYGKSWFWYQLMAMSQVLIQALHRRKERLLVCSKWMP